MTNQNGVNVFSASEIPSPNEKPGASWKWALAACFLLLALLGSRLLSDSDLGFHLKGGQWIAQNHRWITQDSYTYTAAGNPYLDIHWLYQVFLYIIYRLGGYPFLSALNLLILGLVFFLALLRIRWTGAPLWVCAFLLTAAILASEIRFRVRPETVSWLLMSLTLLVLERRASGKPTPLLLLPVIHLVWANVEGLFPLGWTLMGVYWLKSVKFYRQDAKTPSGIHTSSSERKSENRFFDLLIRTEHDRQLVIFFILSVAACFLNPNLLNGVLYPLSHLSMLGTANPFKRAIGELQSPWFTGSAGFLFTPWLSLGAYKAYSLLLLFLLAATFKKRQAHEILLALSFFGLSATALRNIPIFLLATLPLAATCWMDLSWQWLQKFQDGFLRRPFCAWVFIICLLAFGTRVVTNAYYVSDRREDRFGWGLDKERMPVAMVAFLLEHHLDGRMLNSIHYGGWLEWEDNSRAFIDGRLEVFGPDFFAEYSASYQNGLDRLAEKYGADLIAFPTDKVLGWAVQLKAMKNWRLAYMDSHAALYLRQGYAPGVPALEPARVLGDAGVSLPLSSSMENTVLTAPVPPTWRSWLEGFYRPQEFPYVLFNPAVVYFVTGEPQAAEALFLEAIRRSGGAYFEIDLNLGEMYFREGRFAEARLCARRVLEARPGNPTALQILAAAP